MNPPTDAYQTALRLLHGYRQKQKREKLLAVLFKGLRWSVAAGAILCVLEALFRFHPTIRTILVTGFLLALTALLILSVVLLFSLLFRKKVPADERLALQIGGCDPAIKDRFTDALQVVRKGGALYGTSDDLAAISLERVIEHVQRHDPDDFLADTRWKRERALFSASILIFAVMILLRPFGDALHRLVHPRRYYRAPTAFQLEVSPGNATIVQGEHVEIAVHGTGEIPEEMILFIEDGTGSIHEHVLESPFTHRVTSVNQDLFYGVRAGRVETPTYTLRVLERPMVRSLRVEVRSPAYARLGTRVLEPNSGTIEALRGASVRVDVTASKPLEEATLAFDERDEVPMKVDGAAASGFFLTEEEDRYRVNLMDTSGIPNVLPISFPVRILPDASPVARIVAPAGDVDLDERMVLSLALSAEDDFGLSGAGLVYTILSGALEDPGDTLYHPLSLSEDEPVMMFQEYDWDLESLDLLPEDVVTYCFEVRDNDRVSGPKRGRSRWFRARFPSIYEIFEEAEAEQESQLETLEGIAEESRELRDVLESISEDIKSGEEWGWEDRKTMEGTREKQERMMEEVDSLKSRLEEITDRMDRNDLLTLETLEKYEELQQLYDEMASPELMDAMKKLQEAMKQLSEEDVKRAAERFQLNQESFLRSIERTISLLKRVQIEQRVDEILGRIEDLLQRQSAINDALAGEESMDPLAEKEAAASRDAEELRSSLDDLYRRMEELPGMPMEDLGAVMEEMEWQRIPQRMDRAVENMRADRRESARSEGAEAQQALGSLQDRMRTLQKNLQSGQKERVAGALRRASHRLLRLSRGEEALMQGTAGGSVSGSEAARRQQSLMSGLSGVIDSLIQLSDQTFFVTPEMGRSLGQAQAQMGRALQQMEEGRGAPGPQGEAMGALNRSVVAIQEALGRMQGAGSGLGMEAFMLQLEQMGMEQMRINQQMMDMLQQGSFSLEQQAAMARLAAEQEALKRTLEEALQRFGEASEIPGRLDNLVGEMEAIVQEMRQYGARTETLQRQERILSRLLDAQRSVRQRDRSRKRRAETGKDVPRRGPEGLRLEVAEWRERIRRDILRMGKEGYTQEYQDLIRKYFEALASEKH